MSIEDAEGLPRKFQTSETIYLLPSVCAPRTAGVVLVAMSTASTFSAPGLAGRL